MQPRRHTSTSGPDELIDAIRRIHDGDAVFSPRLAGVVLDAFAGAAPPFDPEIDQLTPREREVLRFIARGYTYREAARELHLSVKTLECSRLVLMVFPLGFSKLIDPQSDRGESLPKS